METQDVMNLETGDKEAAKLKPTKVKIVDVRVEEVGKNNNPKLVCKVKHPDKEETIDVSAVKYENKGNLQVTGLWVNLDEDEKIRKGSALAVLISFLGLKVPSDLKDKEIDTAEDDRGYLCFKAY